MATAELIADNRTALQPRQRFVVYDLAWKQYRQISDALTGTRVRLTYDRGVLELMTKSTLHGLLSQLYGDFLVILADEFDLPLRCTGDMTCDRADLERGTEPDQSYYLVNAPRILARVQIDFAIDPPPDLMIEVDLSRSSDVRLGIYAALSVPEVWQVGADSLAILQLNAAGEYGTSEQSRYFPGIALREAVTIANRRDQVDDLTLQREFRAWVRQQRGAHP